MARTVRADERLAYAPLILFDVRNIVGGNGGAVGVVDHDAHETTRDDFDGR